ncbi:MAG TPA: DUF992 domain-containing protein [Caulobacteraceae bacterium]
MRRMLMACVALAGALALPSVTSAADARVKIGTLSCNESSGWGFIVGSHEIRCAFDNGHRVEYYSGHISKFGAVAGYQKSGVLVWAVLAPTDHINPGALKGHYGGLTAGASVGVGAGANALIGGNNRTIVLQPISVEGLSGINLAAGIGELTLHQRPR